MNDGTLLFVNFAAYAWLLLLPSTGIEAWELRKTLPVSPGRALAAAGLANLASTLLASIAVLATGWVLGFLDVIAQPQAGEGDVAALLAVVPCYFLAVWCEPLAVRPLLKGIGLQDLRAAFVRANQLSYAMLAVVPVARFAKSAVVNGRFIW